MESLCANDLNNIQEYNPSHSGELSDLSIDASEVKGRIQPEHDRDHNSHSQVRSG
jgi:hypothetical protein